jgi:predicted HTH domain antitoxin
MDEEMKIEIAVMHFEQERLSLRKSALMADMHWLNFMKELDKRSITIHYDETLL